MEFSRQEYWSGLPFPSPGDLPDPGIEPRSPALQADALPSEPPGTPLVLTGAMDLKLSAAAQTSHALNGHIFKTPAFPEKLSFKPSVGEGPVVFCLLVCFKFSIHHAILLKSSVKKGTSADIENGPVDAVGEGEGGTDWKSSPETYTLPYVKQIAGGNLLYEAGSSNPVL